MNIGVQTALSSVPTELSGPLLETYREIVANFAEHRWEPSELNGGKFCEIVYTIVDGALGGSFASAPFKPSNMKTACTSLEQRQTTGNAGDRSLRVLIPRMLLPLYEIRNNRGVGHVGGDVNPNLMDAAAVYAMASWIMAELIRVFHAVSTVEAQEIVDALSERKLPLIWAPGTTARRVLDTNLSVSKQTLLLLYQSAGWVSEQELFVSVEYSKISSYRSNVLQRLHKDRSIEHDQKEKRARISPKGSERVEREILITRNAK